MGVGERILPLERGSVSEVCVSPLMPGQSHLERDHYEHQVHIEADVEQAQSGFGGEAFRSSWTMARRVRLVPTYEISGVLR